MHLNEKLQLFWTASNEIMNKNRTIFEILEEQSLTISL